MSILDALSFILITLYILWSMQNIYKKNFFDFCIP